jgi:uncharacterized membrane protein
LEKKKCLLPEIQPGDYNTTTTTTTTTTTATTTATTTTTTPTTTTAATTTTATTAAATAAAATAAAATTAAAAATAATPTTAAAATTTTTTQLYSQLNSTKLRDFVGRNKLRFFLEMKQNFIYVFFMAQQPLVGHDLTVEASRSHSVGLLGTGDEPDSETST